MLFPLQLQYKQERLRYKSSYKAEDKLLLTLQNRYNYPVYHENLFYYIRQGLILSKIHRIIEFDQSSWMKPYIMFNTIKRNITKNAFEKDFYKLMNNSVFGKTMEDVRKYRHVRIVTDPEQIVKLGF